MPSEPSESSTTRRWLNDILYHIDLAQRFAAGMDHEAFRDDLVRFYAVTRCLEIISEASRRLPDEMKARHPSISGRTWQVRAVYIATAMRMSASRLCGLRSRTICRRCGL